MRRFWNGVAILALLAAYPELYAGYETERLISMGNREDALQYHLMSAAIRISRGIRLVQLMLVRANNT